MTDPHPVALKFARARRLRRGQTNAELALWLRLRAGRLNGLRFRRQFPIGDFIADFCCKERHLVIELDGGQHIEPRAQQQDRLRSELINQRGYRILRFWNNEVLTNIDGVLSAIVDAANEIGTTDI